MMKARNLIALSALLSLSTLATAQTDTTTPAAAMQSVIVSGKSTFKLAPSDFDSYQYAYTLPAGEKIVFTRRVNRYYGQISSKKVAGPVVELVPTSPDTFVSADGALVEFKDDGEHVFVTSPERLRTPRRLASR
jgi:hypothetical protein